MQEILKDPEEIYSYSKMIQFLMVCGKKSKAKRILEDSISYAIEGATNSATNSATNNSSQDKKNSFLLEAILNTAPDLEIKSKRIGSTSYQIPKPITRKKKLKIGVSNLIEAAKLRKENTMVLRLGSELRDAYNSKGSAVKKKEDLHKLAESNKSFAHFNF